MKHKIIALVLIFALAFTLAIPAAAASYGPVDVLADNPEYIGIGVVIGIVLALIITFAFKAQLKNVAKGTTASNFVSQDLVLTSRSDHFTHRTTTRVKIEKKDN